MSILKILIVEDEAIVAQDIASCLTKMGYVVAAIVASGEAAIIAATTTQPNLVLMDIMLQGESNGIVAAEEIRSQLNIPVVYLTAYADDETLKRAKATQPFGYIIKPFKEQELKAAIEIAISRHQAEIALQKALQEVQNLKQQHQESKTNESEYISMTSHELRTPLAVIQSSAEMLQNYSHKLTEEKKQLCLSRICRAADSMNQLLADILVLGQADSGKLECNRTPLDVVSFCQDLIEIMQMSAGENYEFRLTSVGEFQNICLDEKLLWHILNNLLANAVKYSPQGGKISLQVSCFTTEIWFQVQDQGIGISPADQQRLFEPFQRAHNVGQIPGTGLGLSIVKRSVELHGGQIYIQSEVGQGTTFTIKIPY